MRENCLRDTIHTNSIHMYMCDFSNTVDENPRKLSHFPMI